MGFFSKDPIFGSVRDESGDMKKELNNEDLVQAGQQIDMKAGRRAFIRSLGVGAAGTVALGAAGTGVSIAADITQDADVLNFALNLEYLEAEFYLLASTGRGLPAGDTGTKTPQVTGGRKVNFSSSLIAAYAKEIAQDEQHHVEFLRSVLGTKAVARPKIDLATSFTTAARAAGLISNTQTFDAFANDTNFLLAAYIFEDVGVTAYHGAAPVLVNKTYLDAAAGILAVEAYHAGLIRTVLFAEGKSNETQLISNLRQELGPVRSNFGTGKDSGVGTIAAPNVVLADSVSIAFERTTRDVLNIVYGAQNAGNGLFFPAGLNGVIK
jgi:hypothetical protein